MKSRSEKQRRLKDLKEHIIPELANKVSQTQKQLEKARQEATEIALFLTPKSSESPKVSDHALVRYLERRHGFNLDSYRNEILTPERESMIRAGAKSIKVDGLTFRVDGKIIVTCLD